MELVEKDPKVLSFLQLKWVTMILPGRTREVVTYISTHFRSMMDQKVFRADRARMVR